MQKNETQINGHKKMIEDLKKELQKPSEKLASREKGQKPDFSRTFNNAASVIAGFNAEINKKL